MLLSAHSLRKTFAGVVALDDVDFELRAGEIHALMGENGAGKSTLVKVLTGVYQPDGGTIELGRKQVRFSSPSDAVEQGISTVYQEVNLLPNLTVAENICLGREERGPLGIRWPAVKKRAVAALDRLGVKLDANASLGQCSVAEQQLVAIARALDVSCQVLILDEPTSSLDQQEVTQLFEVLRRLRGEGLGIVFITHFLDQVYEISDRVTILRNGRRVAESELARMSRIELVSAMIGKPANEFEARSEQMHAATGPPILSTSGLGRSRSIEGLSLGVFSGEVLGLAGLLGSGRTESLRLLFGIDRWSRGEFRIDGKPLRTFSISSAIKSDLGFCTEDRKGAGIFPGLSVSENIVVVAQAKRGWLRRIGEATRKQLVEDYRARLNIVTSGPEQEIQTLSGGNQQKALLARWLAVNPRLLLLDEPTRGIDVGARFEIEALIRSLQQQGMAFVLVSSELDEVVRLSSKVVVLRDQKMVSELGPADVTIESVTHAIAEERP